MHWILNENPFLVNACDILQHFYSNNIKNCVPCACCCCLSLHEKCYFLLLWTHNTNCYSFIIILLDLPECKNSEHPLTFSLTSKHEMREKLLESCETYFFEWHKLTEVHFILFPHNNSSVDHFLSFNTLSLHWSEYITRNKNRILNLLPFVVSRILNAISHQHIHLNYIQ